MKPRLLQYLFVACVLSMSVSASADASAERPIRQSIDRLAQAWTAADDAKWAAEYWPEGELVNILGDIMPNAAAVRDRTAQILAGPFKGSYFESSVRRIQLLGVDVAVVDTDIRLTNFRALQPGSKRRVILRNRRHRYPVVQRRATKVADAWVVRCHAQGRRYSLFVLSYDHFLESRDLPK